MHRSMVLRLTSMSLALLLALPVTAQAQAGVITGSVVTAEAGRPLEAAEVLLIGAPLRASTDVSGRFRLAGVPAGAQRLVVRAVGLTPDTVAVTVISGQTISIESRLRRPANTISAVAVTAQKRTESVQDVPVPITAYDDRFLKEQSVQQFDALSAYVPGLNVQLQSPNNPGFVIRGITSDDGTSFVEPRVSVFQDGVSISKSRGSVVELFDLERVEVLKGPQGTLFGRGAQIGAVHVIQNKAVNARQTEVTAGGGNFGEIFASAMVNQPIAENKLFGRVAAIYNKRDGFIENAAGGTLNGKNTAAIRTSLRWLPSLSSTVDLVANFQSDDSPGTSFKSLVFNTPGGDRTPFSRAALNGGDSLGINRQVGGVTLLWNQQLGSNWSLTSTSAWRRFYSDEAFDADGTLAPVLQFREVAEGSQLSQEARFNYDAGGRVTGFVGASVFNEKGSQRVPFSTDERSLFALFSPFLAAAGVPRIPLINTDGSANLAVANNPLTGRPFKTQHEEQYQNFGELTAYELFADATVRPTDRLTLTAGVRGTFEDVSNAYEVKNSATPGSLGFILGATPNNLFAPTNGRKEGTGSFRSGVGRAIASYDLGRGYLAFASVSKGRRPNVVVVNAAGTNTLNEETVWSYEGGLKGQLAGGRIQFDANGYRYNYNNFQTSIVRITDQGLQNLTLDVGRATSWGLESSMRGQLTEKVSAFATFGYIDAKFDSLDANGDRQARSGNRFRLTPMHSYSTGVSITALDGTRGKLIVSPNVVYRGRVFFEDLNQPNIRENGYALVNLRAAYALPDRRTEISLIGRNIFDQAYIIDAGNTGNAFGIPTFIAGAPQFLTLQVSYSLR